MPRHLGHSGVKRGKRVLITLRSGEKIVDKFIDRGSNHIQFAEHGRIPKADIVNMVIYKPLSEGGTPFRDTPPVSQ
jgi:hypothetical protein